MEIINSTNKIFFQVKQLWYSVNRILLICITYSAGRILTFPACKRKLFLISSV